MNRPLFARSMMVLSGLWGIIFALLVGLTYILTDAFQGDVAIAGLIMSPLLFAIIGALLILFLQFLISPWLMDFQLRWIYDMSWVQPDQLPKEMFEALMASMQKHNFSIKRIGIIHDGMPTAFTYGHFRKNARIVFSEGLFKLLTPEEQVAVMEHEVGHIVHLDFVFMTVAQAVPLILYLVYITSKEFGRAIARSSSASSSKSGSASGGVAVGFYAVAIISYIFYIISGYMVLFLSRIREYYADKFSAEETNNPGALASALVKISYGMVVADAETQAQLADKDLARKDRSRMTRQTGFTTGIRAMGIADIKSAKGLVMQAYAGSAEAEVSPDAVAMAASWDLVSPWAKYLELNSTHPLTGKRLKNLDNLAMEMGLTPKYPNLGEYKPPESLWDEFFMDFSLMNFLPPLVLIMPVVGYLLGLLFAAEIGGGIGAGAGLVLVGLMWLYRVKIKYPQIDEYDNIDRDQNSVIEALTSLEKDGYYEASPFRGKPIIIDGVVLGRASPGYYLSDDFVVQDRGGLIRVMYSSVVPFANWWFALRTLPKMMGQTVRVVGWYHRSMAPFMQLYKVYRKDGKTHKNHWRGANRVFALLLMVLGVYLAVAGTGIIGL